MNKLLYTDVIRYAVRIVEKIAEITKKCPARVAREDNVYLLYGVPRGGIPVSYLVRGLINENYGWPLKISITEEAGLADFIVDDIIDSGDTRDIYKGRYPKTPFFALIDKKIPINKGLGWVVFPWEHNEEASISHNITRLIQYIGEDPCREGLLETPDRVAKAWKEWTAGYDQKPEDILKIFKDGAESYNEMVIVKDLPFYSHCEHHLAPFFGTATICYIPNGKIVGLSKLSRLLDIFAKRLQVQERLTNQIADAIETHLGAIGVGVVIKARHLCMESRGVCKQGHETITSSLRGALLDKPEARAEFMGFVR